MTEIREGKRIIKEPITAEDIKELKIGEVFYYDGEALTGRDAVHERVVVEGEDLPVDISEKLLMHAGPIVKKDDAGKYEVYGIGPTTSMRMERHEADFIKKTGVKIIAGKGRMAERTEEACRKMGAIHCVMPAGCAVVGAVCTEEVIEGYWLDLGMPEALWHLRVKELGPLIVTIDTSGRNFFNVIRGKSNP